MSGFGGDSNKTYGQDQSETIDILNSGTSLEGTLTVGTSAVEIKVGVNRLTNRELVTLYNSSNSVMYWGFTSSVTTSTGTPIEKNQFVTWAVGDVQTVYVIASSVGNIARITEGA